MIGLGFPLVGTFPQVFYEDLHGTPQEVIKIKLVQSCLIRILYGYYRETFLM